MLDRIIKLLFPPKCIFCGQLIGIETSNEICNICYPKITFVQNDYIYMKGNPHFDGVICVCEYGGAIKEAIVRYKFFNKPGYYRTFGKLLAEKVKKVTSDEKFDIIISVPLYKEREYKRGYNQSYLISTLLSRIIGIAEKSELLCKIKNTNSQSLLTKKERFSNIKGAFKVTCAEKIKGKKILLIDDILTTGSTLNECSKVLKEAGASKVVVAVIASGRKF